MCNLPEHQSWSADGDFFREQLPASGFCDRCGGLHFFERATDCEMAGVCIFRAAAIRFSCGIWPVQRVKAVVGRDAARYWKIICVSLASLGGLEWATNLYR